MGKESNKGEGEAGESVGVRDSSSAGDSVCSSCLTTSVQIDC